MLKTLLLATVFNFQITKDTIPLIDSNQILEQVAVLNQEESFEHSIALLQQVSKNDSNYLLVQTELINTYGKNNQLDRVEKLSQELLQQRSDLTSAFYITLGNTYLTAGKTHRAIETYQAGLRLFPYNYSLIYNIGYSAYADGRYDEALPYLQESLKINPFFSSAHQVLGNLMCRTNQRTKAVLSYLTYLAIKPEENWALIRLNNLLQDGFREEGTMEVDVSNEHFEHYDNLLRSKAALDDRYKSSVDFEAPVAQQSELLIDKIKHIQGTGDFWMDFYVPIFNKISEEKLTQAFIYFILNSSGDDDVTSWLGKHQKEKDEWISLVSSYLTENRVTNRRTVLDSTALYTHWYYDNKNLSAIGAEDGEFNVGPYEFYFSNGRLKASGSYNGNGNKEGTWNYYHENGQLKTTEKYNGNGNIEGLTASYLENGQIRSRANYVDGDIDGFWEWYYPCGNLSEQYPYRNGVGEGKGQVFFKSGELQIEYFVKDGEYDGDYTRYYQSGQISTKYTNKAGKTEGLFESFFENGSKHEIGYYAENELEGEWLTYYANGNLTSKGSFKEGNRIDTWEYYYPNGNRMRTENYDHEGNFNGSMVWYDEDGILHAKREYVGDVLVSYVFYSKKGEVLFEQSNQEGNMVYKRFYPTGEIYSLGVLEQGKLNGAYEIYHPNGNVLNKGTMVEDSWHGLWQEYGEGGNLVTSGTYEDGQLTGYYRTFHENGQVSQEGWLVNGDIQQRWVEYFMNGSVQRDYAYKNAKLHGDSRYYDPQGRLFSIEQYEEGTQTGLKQYDTLGSIHHEWTLPMKGGKIETKNPSGSLYMSRTKNCGEDVEDVIYYYPSGSIKTVYSVKNAQFQTYKNFKKNSKPAASGSYLGGEQHGEWTFFFDNGEISSKRTYVFGKKEGKSYAYYENGTLESECDRYQDEREGACKYYDPSGALQVVKLYKKDYGLYGYQYRKENGVLSDTIRLEKAKEKETLNAYFENGKPSLVQNLEMGYYHGSVKYFSKEGHAINEDYYQNGLLMGISKEHHPDGKIKIETTYYYDTRHGEEKEYHQNGQLKEVTNWVYGVRDGWNRTFDENGKLQSETYFWNDGEY